jgi:hypothetical protein
MSTADVTNKVHALMYVSFVMLNIQEAPAGIFCDGAMRCRWKTTQVPHGSLSLLFILTLPFIQP